MRHQLISVQIERGQDPGEAPGLDHRRDHDPVPDRKHPKGRPEPSRRHLRRIRRGAFCQ